MEFFIKQNSLSPILLMSPVNNGRNDAHKSFSNLLETASIRFSMQDTKNGIHKIIMENAFIVNKIYNNPETPNEYYVCYKWSGSDTNKKGRYIAEFTIVSNDGTLITPIHEELFINII